MHAAVVDPSKATLDAIAALLSDQGMVTGFTDSAAALAYVQGVPTVDVLITGLDVQPISGLELCWQSRVSLPPERPLYIMVMAPLRDAQVLAEALDCGADDLIAQPVHGVELSARLRLAGRLRTNLLNLVRLTETDPLSGLLNRRAFFARVGRLLDDRTPGQCLSAIMFDIDHFKQVNDRYGHQTGDQVIRQIATEASKVAGVAGRLGGEEFAIVLKNYDGNRTLALAEVLRQRCAAIQYASGDESFSVSCSFGVGEFQTGDCIDDLLQRADLALYKAKAEGRNCVRRSARTPRGHALKPSSRIRNRAR